MWNDFVVDECERYIGCISTGDVMRAVQNNEDVCINYKSKYILNDDSKYKNIYEIQQKNKNIIIVPVLDSQTGCILEGIRLKNKYEMMRQDCYSCAEEIYTNSYELRNYMKENNADIIYLIGSNLAHTLFYGKILKENGIVNQVVYVCLDEKYIQIWVTKANEKVITFSEWLEGDKGVYMLTDMEMYDEGALDRKSAWNSVPDLLEILNDYGVQIRYVSIPNTMKIENTACDIYFFDNGFDIWEKAEAGTCEEKRSKYKQLKKDLLGIRLRKDEGGVIHVQDYSSKYVNFCDGYRVGCRTEKEHNTIYLLGPCMVVGSFCDDEHTIGNYLQGMVENYNVVSLGGAEPSNYIGLLGRIKVKRGDYIYNLQR